MDAIDDIQRLRAFEAGHAMPLATVRHVHLAERPLMVAAYHLSGDEGAPVGLILGSLRDAFDVIVVGEPRNRDLRFASLVSLSDRVAQYLDGFGRVRMESRQTRTGITEYPVADDAPQLLFANSPTANWFCGLLGRALRYLPTDGDRAVDPKIPRLGRDLSFFSERRQVVGQSLVVVATEFAPLHWATGQTPSEDQNVISLAAWIAPELMEARQATRVDRTELFRLAEGLPAAGPVPEPVWDADILQDLVADFGAAARAGAPTEPAIRALELAVREALEPAWQATWDLAARLAHLPEGAHVPARWQADLRAWGNHLDRVRNDRAWFRRVPTAVGAARMLAASESSLERMSREMALDDPLVAAKAVVSGEAVEGRIERLNLSHRELGPSGRTRVYRPLLTLRTDAPCEIPTGTTLNWSLVPSVTANLIDVSDDGQDITLMVIRGQGRGLPNPSALPGIGDTVVFGPWPEREYFPSTLPSEIPWTHRLEVVPDAELEPAS